MRTKLAKIILKYSLNDKDYRLILLRDFNGIINGKFRDIDIFAYKFNYNSFRNYLVKNGFYIVKYVSRYDFNQFALGSKFSDDIILVDIWSTLNYKGIPYFKNFKIKSEFFNNEYYRIQNTQSLEISCIKCLSQNNRIKDKYLKLLEDNNIDLSKIVAKSFLETKTIDTLSFFYKRLSWAINFIRSVFTCNQFVLYLIGPDGAGKTTISDKLINSEFRSNVLYFHGRLPILPRLKVFSPKKIKKAAYSDSHKRKFTIFHTLYYIFDSLLCRLYLNLFFWKDRLIIFDRTHYDIVARETYRNVPFLLQYLLIKSLYKPHACALLYCDPVLINQRKPELPPSEIKSQYLKYNENSKLLNFTQINTMDCDLSISLICKYIFENYYSNR